ncbi:rod-determining factor RdfA [Halomarina litorea]|uniref:rod-determining factor RdfA n=1 Tax=Halomarina litorea TaxID=2961595 RepID=UPI0020C45D0A|nr:rod-determining factor RdfA [Halomarina sp. BCD28]
MAGWRDKCGAEGREPCCKLGRGIEQYDLGALDDQLAARWRGDGVEKHSLRDLAEYVNRQMLERALALAGVRPVDGEVANLYRLLVDDDVSEGRRREAERRLEREGIDVAAVRGAFVSHQSVYTHLRDCRGVTYEETVDDTARVERRASALFALQNRAETVTAETLEQLRSADLIALDEFDVLVDVRVACDGCGRYHEVDDLLERRGCDCQTTSND